MASVGISGLVTMVDVENVLKRGRIQIHKVAHRRRPKNLPLRMGGAKTWRPVHAA